MTQNDQNTTYQLISETKSFRVQHQIRSVDCSPCGKYVACAADCDIMIFDLIEQKFLEQILEGHTGFIFQLRYSPNGLMLASCSKDSIIIWDASTFQKLGSTLKGHQDWVNCIDFAPDNIHLISGGDDKTLKIWDCNSFELIYSLTVSYDIRTVKYSPNGSQFISAGGSSDIDVWDAKHRVVQLKLIGLSDEVNSVNYSKDGLYIVSASDDNTIKVWDSYTGNQIGNDFLGHQGMICSVAFLPDSRFIVSCSYDKTVRFWYRESKKDYIIHTSQVEEEVYDVTFFRDGSQIIAGSDGELSISKIMIQNFSNNSCEPLQISNESKTNDGQKYTFNYFDNIIGCQNINTSVPLQQLDQSSIDQNIPLFKKIFTINHEIHRFDLSPCGKFIACAIKDKIYLFDMIQQKIIRRGLKKDIQQISYSPNGLMIASSTSDYKIIIWDASTLQKLGNTLKGHQDTTNCINFAPDNIHLISGGDDKTLKIWDCNSLKLIHSLTVSYNIFTVKYSPNGSQFISAGESSYIDVWDSKQRVVLFQLNSYREDVNQVIYSSDGNYIISEAKYNHIKVWNAQTGIQIGKDFVPHEQKYDQLQSIACSADSKLIISCSYLGNVRSWNIQSGSYHILHKLHHNVSVSKNGNYIIEKLELPRFQVLKIITK